MDIGNIMTGRNLKEELEWMWRPDLALSDFSAYVKHTKIGKNFKRIGSRIRTHSMIIRRSGIKKILDYVKKHGIFVPYEYDIALIPNIQLYTLNYDLITFSDSHSDTKAKNFSNHSKEATNLNLCSEKNIFSLLNTPEKNRTLISLEKDFQHIHNFKLKISRKHYFIRCNNVNVSLIRRQREFYVTQEAFKKGLAPLIRYATKDRTIIVSDYPEGKPLTSNEAKMPENIEKLALMLRKIHEISPYPIARRPLLKRLQSMFNSLKERNIVLPIIDRVGLSTIFFIENFVFSNAYRVTTHGNLNSKNIFLVDKREILLDWSSTGYEDPLYDLACLSLSFNFTKKEDEILLATYLEKNISVTEKLRFKIIKFINRMYRTFITDGVN